MMVRPGSAGRVTRWAEETSSPRPSGGDRAALSACPETDRALDVVAAELAAGMVRATDVEALTHALRVAGEPHVWPRALLLQARAIDHAAANARLTAWLGDSPHFGRIRCGVALAPAATQNGVDVIAAVAVDAEADLAPVPMRVRASSWIDIDARALVPASGARVIALSPSGAPRTLTTSYGESHVRARANVDHPGRWLFQVVLDGDHGPRPVLEAYVFAGVEPADSPVSSLAPGEDAVDAGGATETLARMLAGARASESMPPLTRQQGLDHVAAAHAERMMRASLLAHDAGDGDPLLRVERADIATREVGENVAHATTVALAHHALWSSPSHRCNMLDHRFDRVGLGTAIAPDGSVWVTELFAR